MAIEINRSTDDYKFHYGQKVRVLHGFFKGQVGTIIGSCAIPWWRTSKNQTNAWKIDNAVINQYGNQYFAEDMLEVINENNME